MYKEQLIHFAKKHGSTILSCIGAAGVIATTIMAVKATPKAVELVKENSRKNHDGDPYAYSKKEAIASCWKCYVPTAIVGTSTLMCIFGANVLNKRQQASLASVYALLDSSYKKYRTKAKEIFGDDADAQIREAIAQADWVDAENPDIYPTTGLETFSKDCDKVLFYDDFSHRYFESTVPDVLAAEYHLNRNFTMRGTSDPNEFYSFLGIDDIDGGEDVGWSMSYGYSWLDFEHKKVKLEDGVENGLECYVIYFVFSPEADYMDF